MPHFNRSDLLRATLESAIAQVYLNWECILVDDGTTDYT
ncbi:glycosyltransferase [Salinimicrobium sp. TH3]